MKNIKLSGKNNPMYGKRGTLAPNYIDGRTNKKYCCRDCGRKISLSAGIYGEGRCHSCSKKGKKNYFWTKGKPNCVDCGKELSSYEAKRCKPCSNRWSWKNINLKKKRIKNILKSLKLKPNKKEKMLNKLLNKLLPKEYKFVGDGQVIIIGFCPDFINCNGQKKIIELYGDYWHNKPEVIERDKRRLIAYKKYGYVTLIVWEHELKDLNRLKNKILEFHL